MAGLSAGFSLAFLFAASFPGLARQSIGGRGFGGCGGILQAQCQLAFEIGDLLSELLIWLAELLLQVLHLPVQALVFATQGLPIRLLMAFRARSSALGSH